MEKFRYEIFVKSNASQKDIKLPIEIHQSKGIDNSELYIFLRCVGLYRAEITILALYILILNFHKLQRK